MNFGQSFVDLASIASRTPQWRSATPTNFIVDDHHQKTSLEAKNKPQTSLETVE
ncbi:hypothetical protein D8674_021936 [Pyrus ussuriensis x Pyrus communis]|uniref:Uncharacterized protein n=1 Tax=Pyrus ussuriensis x Pyrus communis TaxID=2448454 RepID=A0A5N5GJ12_9ROSA|nr:hypothetical protein D8674_021936 [Pyrus ussuriensis x Pyrus communis]